MGRLFWKFFAFFWLAQLTSVVGVGVTFWLRNEMQQRIPDAVDASPPAAFHSAAAAATLRHGGIDALRSLLEESSQDAGQLPGLPVYAIDETGSELLGRALSPEIVAALDSLAGDAEKHSGVEAVAAGGHRYLLFVPPHRRPGGPATDAPPGGPGPQLGGNPQPRPRGGGLPLMPLAAGALVSLVFAALLAGYVARPIRNLRAAFEAAADGRLEQRLAPAMGRRRDELADLGRDFDRMASRLKSLMDSQRRLLHDVSHELRSPLARLQAAIGLVRQQPERIDDFVARIERESGRMDTLVSELLTLSRIEAGMAGKLDEAVNLGELLGDVVDDARFEAAVRACRVEFAATDAAPVRGNAELLYRAIENIVRNAVKHAPPGSRVEIDLAPSGERVIVRVQDAGPGVAESDLQAIFAPFFRGSAVTAQDGHGLGLAISQRVVEAHQGTIVAANRPGGGLCVTVSLPSGTV